MKLLLPPKADGKRIELPEDARQVTIIGANGSGKTRFTEYLQQMPEMKVFRLSALEALTDVNYRIREQGSIDEIFNEAVKSPAFLHGSGSTTMFDRLMTLLLNEEMQKLVEWKMASVRGDVQPIPESRLDAVIRSWQEMFPSNHVLREGGALLFSRSGESGSYSPKRLSHGERAVLYYFGAVLYAPEGATVFVDNPGIFMHSSMLRVLWDTIEDMRPDCRFVYTTHDVDFAASRLENVIVWVRSYDPDRNTWDYDLLPADAGLSEEVYMALVGARKPVLFIEGDSTHSIDSKLYPLIFREHSVKALGSCNKVIEATRAFNDLKGFHHLDSFGIVDRDRRDSAEVKYLRGKNVYVPEVAEIENILMLEDVIRAVAHAHGREPHRVFRAVKDSIISQFRHDLRQQALLHTRHRVKRTVEYRIDGRFTNINALEDHMNSLVREINPRGLYESFCREFSRYVADEDYASILRVYNQKSMIPRSNVSGLCGLSGSKDAYVQAILSILKGNSPDALRIREAIRRCFGLDKPAEDVEKEQAPAPAEGQPKKKKN